MAVVPNIRENDRDTDDVARVSQFSNERNIKRSAAPERPKTFRSDGSSVRLGFGGHDREEGLVRDTPLRGQGTIKRGFRGSDLGPETIRNTPFSQSGTPLERGFADFDTPSRARRGTEQGRFNRPPSRVRPPNKAAAAAPPKPKFRTERGTNFSKPAGSSGSPFGGPFFIKAPFEKPGDTAREGAARRLVTNTDAGEVRDFAADRELLQGPGIAGLSESAVEQESANFASVTDPTTGAVVPNLADEKTEAAFNRFFAPDDLTFGGDRTKQDMIDADPTRAAFQNQFFESETLKDVFA